MLFPYAITLCSVSWTQWKSGNWKSRFKPKLISCNLLKPARKSLLKYVMLFEFKVSITRLHFEEHSGGGEVRRLVLNLTTDTFLRPQNPPTSMCSKPTFDRMSSCNIKNKVVFLEVHDTPELSLLIKCQSSQSNFLLSIGKQVMRKNCVVLMNIYWVLPTNLCTYMHIYKYMSIQLYIHLDNMHVSMHWKQGKLRFWANWLISWMPTLCRGPNFLHCQYFPLFHIHREIWLSVLSFRYFCAVYYAWKYPKTHSDPRVVFVCTFHYLIIIIIQTYRLIWRHWT